MNTDNMGEFRFKVEGTFVNSFEYTDSDGNVSEFAGTWTQPEWRANGTIAWRYGDWAAALYIDYVGSYDGLYGDTIKSYTRFNPQVAFSGWYDTTITVGIRNVFDKEPPVDIADTTTRAIGVHNIEPRFMYVRLSKDW
jgi:iron complex outermembrane receptor protein